MNRLRILKRLTGSSKGDGEQANGPRASMTYPLVGSPRQTSVRVPLMPSSADIYSPSNSDSLSGRALYSKATDSEDGTVLLSPSGPLSDSLSPDRAASASLSPIQQVPKDTKGRRSKWYLDIPNQSDPPPVPPSPASSHGFPLPAFAMILGDVGTPITTPLSPHHSHFHYDSINENGAVDGLDEILIQGPCRSPSNSQFGIKGVPLSVALAHGDSLELAYIDASSVPTTSTSDMSDITVIGENRYRVPDYNSPDDDDGHVPVEDAHIKDLLINKHKDKKKDFNLRPCSSPL